jgi:hypothetical protein
LSVPLSRSRARRSLTLRSEDAVEHGELDIFLRLKEDYDATVEEDRPLLEEKVIGVPGVSPMPSPMSTPSKPRVSTTASAASALSPGGPGVPATPALPRVPPPTPIQKQNGFDVGDQLSGFGLQVSAVRRVVREAG